MFTREALNTSIEGAQVFTPEASNNIIKIWFRPSVVVDRPKTTMFVEFVRGGVYMYEDVGEDVVEALINVAKEKTSFGSFVATRLKGKYTTTKVFNTLLD